MVKREELIFYTIYISKKTIPYEIAEYIITFYYTWVFETKEELKKAIKEHYTWVFEPKEKLRKDVKEYDNYGDPNFWDVSNVKDMKFIFHCTEFNKDISKWDVSNVKDTTCMFDNSKLEEEGKTPKWYKE